MACRPSPTQTALALPFAPSVTQVRGSRAPAGSLPLTRALPAAAEATVLTAGPARVTWPRVTRCARRQLTQAALPCPDCGLLTWGWREAVCVCVNLDVMLVQSGARRPGGGGREREGEWKRRGREGGVSAK